MGITTRIITDKRFGYGISIIISTAFFFSGLIWDKMPFYWGFTIASILGGFGTLFTYLVTNVETFKKDIDSIKRTNAEKHKVHDALLATSKKFSRVNPILKHLNCELKIEEMDSTWEKVSWHLEDTYLTVNYERDVYDSRGSKNCLAIQDLKALTGVTVKKIIIIDALEELYPMIDTIRTHLLNGIKVKYILRDRIESLPKLCNGFRTKASLDYSVIDGNMLFAWQLDNDRKCVGGSISFSKAEVKAHQKFFTNTLLVEAKDITIATLDEFLLNNSSSAKNLVA